ncbi:MAG: IPTL-CTERM sorting domain-containing protein [Acidobacteria bacterium]|nr:IPTL-CTERM sorting domain-containing protein [Acidobacteriota bacterium]
MFPVSVLEIPTLDGLGLALLALLTGAMAVRRLRRSTPGR